MSAADPLWGQIDERSWSSIRFLAGRVAEEHDVKEGRAVFYLQGASEFASAFPIPLPRCAWLTGEGKPRQPVVVIQAEKADEKIYVGYRDFAGGNGICTVSEIEFVDDPDSRFFPKNA